MSKKAKGIGTGGRVKPSSSVRVDDGIGDCDEAVGSDGKAETPSRTGQQDELLLPSLPSFPRPFGLTSVDAISVLPSLIYLVAWFPYRVIAA
jgi:hypothetical protein